MDIPNYNHKLQETLKEAHNLRFSNPQKALDKANFVYINALKSGDQKLEARSLYEMGRCFELAASYPQAMKCFSESIKIANSIGDTQTMADSINSIGIINDKLNNYSNALKAYFKALRLYDFLENKKRKAIVLSNIGLIYTNISDFKSALKFYSQALELAEDEMDDESLLVININIGLTHQRLGNYKDARMFLNDAIKIADLKNDKHRKSLALDIIAEVESSLKNLQKAYDILYESLEIKKELNDKSGISKIYSFLGQLQLIEEKFDDAKFSFLESVKIADEIGLKKTIFESYKSLSDIYEKQENHKKSLEYLKDAYKLELEYIMEESEVKAKNITTQLEIEQAQKEAELERLKNVELAKALEEVKQLNISLKDLNDEKNEFMAIAVHDLKNPIQNILSTARVIKNSDELSKESVEEFTVNIINQTDRMFGLIKKLLDHNAIEQGQIHINNSVFNVNVLLDELYDNFKESALQKNITIIYEKVLFETVVNTDKVILYEVLQNLLSNAIKFSPSNKNITLNSLVSDKKVSIGIKDEGPGFTDKDKLKIFSKFTRLSAKPTANEHSTGLGLSIVKRLCDIIGAEIFFESQEGSGAKFVISLRLSH